MSDWDEDSSQLRANLHQVLSDIRRDALQRVKPTVEAARTWQSNTMHRLATPGPQYVGRFRGEAGLEDCEVAIGNYHGVTADQVAKELKAFEENSKKWWKRSTRRFSLASI